MYAKEDEAVLAYRKAERHFFQRMKVSSIFSPALHVLAILIILTIQLKIILFRMLQLSLHDSEIVRYIAQVMHCSLKRPGCRFFSKILLSVGNMLSFLIKHSINFFSLTDSHSSLHDVPIQTFKH